MARVSDEELYQLAEQLGGLLKDRGMMLTIAESCTGGWTAQCITAVPGASAWFDRGFITYTNQSKQDMLDVTAAALEQFGAVSEETVLEMAAGALKHSRAQVSLSISGIAGPGGGTRNKPVGTVCIAWGLENRAPVSTTCRLSGDRAEIRSRAVASALRGLIELLA